MPPLCALYTHQAEPAYCGISTLTMILNAFGVDPERVWKGPWRWFHEDMLTCMAPLDVSTRQPGPVAAAYASPGVPSTLSPLPTSRVLSCRPAPTRFE